MKILHIIDHIGVGGAQRVVEGIIEKCGEKNQIFCYALRKHESRLVNHKNLFIRNTSFTFDLLSLFEIKRLIEREKIQILHCHLYKAYLIGYLLKKLFFRKIKINFHNHGRIFRNSKIYNFFLRYVKDNIDLFLAVSKTTKQKLIENAGIPEEKIVVLYNFVDLEKFNPEISKKHRRNKERKMMGIERDDFVVGFAGRLVNYKGWKEFISSARILTEKGLKLKFLVAGNGSDKQKLINLIDELNLLNKVFYVGLVLDMGFFYSMLDCFVIPSHSEAMGITGLEAQACGIPVVASDIPGLNETIRDHETGLTFRPKKAEDLARKIELIYKDEKLRKTLIRNGLENAKKYCLNDYLVTLNKLYDNL